MKSSFDIVSLIRKKIEGTLNDQELGLLEEWVGEDSWRAELLKKVEDEETLLSDFRSWLDLRIDDHDNWQQEFEDKTIAKLQRSSTLTPTVRFIRWKRYLSVAALLVAMLGVIFWYSWIESRPENVQTISDLAPGTSRAQIKLADGRIIQLSSDQNGVILGEQLRYEDGTFIQAMGGSESTVATITTPKGGKYQITLSDGTKVWLNAGSEMKYPIRFVGDTRQVELTGEAYFDVSKSNKNGKSIPFVVKTVGLEIEVLGTEFNLKCYADDQEDIRTTLVEGAVTLHSSGNAMQLSPGEQGLNGVRGLSKRKVDVAPYIAWKDNWFVFEEVELREALKILGRWYDFDFEIEKGVKSTQFYASISRDKSLKEVLNILESSGIKFNLVRDGERNKLLIFN